MPSVLKKQQKSHNPPKHHPNKQLKQTTSVPPDQSPEEHLNNKFQGRDIKKLALQSSNQQNSPISMNFTPISMNSTSIQNMHNTKSAYIKENSEIPALTRYIPSSDPELEENYELNKVFNKSFVQSQVVGIDIFQQKGANRLSNQKSHQDHQNHLREEFDQNQWIDGGRDSQQQQVKQSRRSPATTNRNKIPPLSKWEEHIQAKYQQKQQSEDERANPDTQALPQSPYLMKPVTEHHENSISEQPLESLRQSRIANEDAEHNNSWIFENQDFYHEDHQDTTHIKPTKDVENPFKKHSPFNFDRNNLYTPQIAEFGEDFQQGDQTGGVIEEPSGSHPFNVNERIENFKLNDNPLSEEPQKVHNSSQKMNMQGICLEAYDFIFKGKPTERSPSPRNEKIFIREELEERVGTQRVFANSQNQADPSKSSTDRDKIVQQRYQFSQSNSKSFFFQEKSASQIISATLSDEKKLKLYLKYLQKIIINLPEEKGQKQEEKVSNLEILACLLIKIKQISTQNTQKDMSRNISTQILYMFQSEPKPKKQQKFSPQITRSANKIKIDFDPYYKSQKEALNERISSLKKQIEDKAKQTELVKLSYDEIIHDYAESLKNLQSKAEICSVRGKQVSSVLPENQSQVNQRQNSEKYFLEIESMNRGSVEQKIHRKTTFGKAPSSMRNSLSHYDI